MIFYSWPMMCKVSQGRASVIVLILKAILRKKYIRKRPGTNDLSRFYYNTDFSGPSFLINPRTLMSHMHLYTDREIAEYVGLASFRSYGDYKILAQKSLNMDISPLTLEQINNNRLLSMKDNYIHFKYEEYEKESNT